MLLSYLQPAAVVGAPYVVRPGVAAGVAGPAGALLSSDDRSELNATGPGSGADGGAGARRRAAGKSRGAAGEDAASAMVTVAAYCRTFALRAFAVLFKAYPRAFFGRWPLVLDFQSGESSRTMGAAGSYPLLLVICQQDPVQKVRAAALGGICALLEAPNVRTWPVPLEAGAAGALPARGTAKPSFTPLATLVASTLRQSHDLVFGLLQSKSQADVQCALRACGGLLANTPYPKLKPGLLSRTVRSIMPFVCGAVGAELRLDSVPQTFSASVTALAAAMKRDDCAEELGRCFYGGGDGSAPPRPTSLAEEQTHEHKQQMRMLPCLLRNKQTMKK